jgi:quinol-cytochrome oxidoreductase complex cytochrome b subunit
MVAVVFLHMIRVFLTGAYKNGKAVGSNRPLNWIIGVGLLLSTLLLSFTGYLLPWDQLAFWAITVGTNIASSAPLVGEKIRFLLLGGNFIDQGALLRFYVLHVFFLPAILVFLFAWHMWRIRKDGGLAVTEHEALEQKPEQSEPVKSKTYSLLGITNGTTVHVQTSMVNEEVNSVPSVPNLTRRIWLVSLATIIVVVLLAFLFPAPLEEAANAAVTPNPAKAPWYFLWLQEIVTDTTIHLGSFTINGALIGGVLLPGLLIALALWWPYRDRTGINSVGVWFAPERKRQNQMFILICLLVIIFTIIGTFLRGPYWNFYWPWEAWPQMPVKF